MSKIKRQYGNDLIITSGNLGIGTNTPSSSLDVVSSSTTVAEIQSTGSASYIRFINSGNDNGYIGTATDGSMEIFTSNVKRLIIASDGKVTFNNPVIIPSTSYFIGNAASGYRFNNSTDTTNLLVIKDNGNIGVGESLPDYPLEVARGQEDLLSLKRPGIGEWVFGVTAANSLSIGDVAEKHVYIDTEGNVGIGTSTTLFNAAGRTTTTINGTSSANLSFGVGGVGYGNVYADSSLFEIGSTTSNNPINFTIGGATKARIDSSGNLLVGKTTSGSVSVAGAEIQGSGAGFHVRSGGTALYLGRLSTDGAIIELSKDGTTVGTIGSEGGDSMYMGSSDTGLHFSPADLIRPWNPSTNTIRDAVIDLGSSTGRFKDLYLSSSAYIGNGSALSPSLRFGSDDDTGLFSPSANQLSFSCGGTTRMNILSDGRVDVTTTAGSSIITANSNANLAAVTGFIANHNKGTANVVANDYLALAWQSDSNTTSNALRSEIRHVAATVTHASRSSQLEFWTISSGTLSRKMYIGPSGNLFLPTHTTTGAAANAVINSTTGQVQRSTSSRRYKQEILPVSDIMSSKLHAMEAVTYKSAIESDDQETVHLGFIAEQLDEIGLGELVSYHDHGEGLIPESVNYERATVLLVNEVQKLKKDIDAIKAHLGL